MSRYLVWFLNISNALVALTGLVYAWMRYAMQPADPYAVVGHPAQPFVQHLHIWSAPLLIFAFGLIWRQHVWRHWRQGRTAGRRSGLVLMTTAAPMVLSGYFLQTAVEPTWRSVWVALHLVTSALWIVCSLGHALAQKTSERSSDRIG